jgi:hypothetical protein
MTTPTRRTTQTTNALDFPLGRSVVPAAAVRRWHRLPQGARVLVGAGESVRPEQPIAEMPDGTPVLAGLGGRVVEVSPAAGVQLEGVASVVTGLLGLGGSAAGPLAFLTRGESPAVVPIPRGGIIVYPQRLSLTLLQRAAAGGAAGIVAASAAALELEAFVRADLTAVLDGLVPGIERFPLPLLLTEGVGDVAMDPAILEALTKRAGQVALLSGRTVPRWNLRPELVLSLPANTPAARLPVDSTLAPGAQVRIASGELRGTRGELLYVFAQQPGPPGSAGSSAPTAQVRTEDGRLVAVPLANLDRVG